MESIDLRGAPETMLQTLYARAAHSKRPDHKFYDAKAIEVVEQLDYDFSKAGKDMAMSAGVIAWTILLDQMVRQFVDENPNGMVVNIACGLDTRFYPGCVRPCYHQMKRASAERMEKFIRSVSG